MNESDIDIENAILYGNGARFVGVDYGTKDETVIWHQKAMSQYSFGLWYFDDWRCVAEWLRRNK